MNHRKRQYRREEVELLEGLARQESHSSHRRPKSGFEADSDRAGSSRSGRGPRGEPPMDADPSEFQRHLEEYRELNENVRRAVQHEQALVERATRAAQSSPPPPWEQAVRRQMLEDTAFLRDSPTPTLRGQAPPILDLPDTPGPTLHIRLARAAAALALLSAGWLLVRDRSRPEAPGPAGGQAAHAEGLVENPQLLGSTAEDPILNVEFDSVSGRVEIRSIDGGELANGEYDYRAHFHPTDQAPGDFPRGEGYDVREHEFVLQEFLREHDVELSSGAWTLTIWVLNPKGSSEIGYGSVDIRI